MYSIHSQGMIASQRQLLALDPLVEVHTIHLDFALILARTIENRYRRNRRNMSCNCPWDSRRVMFLLSMSMSAATVVDSY